MQIDKRDILFAVVACTCAIGMVYMCLGTGEGRQVAVPSEFWCIDGVEYMKVPGSSYGHIVPHYRPDGSLYTCEE